MRIKRRKKVDLLTIMATVITILLLLSTIIYYNYNYNIIGSKKYDQYVSLNRGSDLRTGPDETFPIIDFLTSGEVVQKQTNVGDWLEVKTNRNIVGWVPGWNIEGSNIKSPDESFKENLKKYKVLINPLNFEENEYEYVSSYSNLLKKSLESLNINVEVLNLDSNNTKNINEKSRVDDYKPDILINIGMSNSDKGKGPEIYYLNNSSKILSLYIENELLKNYIMKTKPSLKSEYLTTLTNNTPEILLIIGNKNNKVDINIIKDFIHKDIYINSVKNGIEQYFYYLLKIDDQNNKRREKLLNMPQKGMDVKFYYTKQKEFKDISYGTDNNKKISDNGELIIALAMINNYVNNDSKITVSSIVDWAGSNYYINGLGTSDLIIPAFAKENSLELDIISSDYIKNINESLSNNRPIIAKFKEGFFGEKVSYKVIRGLEDGKYYINDPNDDDLKLNNYTGFNSNDIEKNIVKAWVLSK